VYCIKQLVVMMDMIDFCIVLQFLNLGKKVILMSKSDSQVQASLNNGSICFVILNFWMGV
jgi:hypothetical protein